MGCLHTDIRFRPSLEILDRPKVRIALTIGRFCNRFLFGQGHYPVFTSDVISVEAMLLIGAAIVVIGIIVAVVVYMNRRRSL